MLRHKAQRREAAGARRVVFEEIKSDGQSIEQPSRNLFVAAFGVPVTAAIAAAKVHADIHLLRRGGEQAVGHRDIFVNERAPIVAARGERALYLGIAEFGKSGFVDLDVTATRRRKGAKLRRESVDRIGPELIHVVICYRGIAAAEVQRAWPRNRDLRPAIRAGFEEVRVGRIDRMVPLHAAADNRDRLRAATASPVRANSVGAANSIDAQLPERAVEKAVIGAATKFAISDKFEAQSLLQPDRIGNGGIFGGGERGRVDLALGKAGAFAQQIGRTQQTADMLGAEWRFSRGHIRRRLRAECHEAPPISGILTPSAFAIAANSSHSFAGIGMPVLRRAASVRLPRSPGSKISSNPARRGRALMIAASPSASVSKSTSGRNVSISITSIAVLAVCRAPFCGPSAGAWIGAAASTLASISNMKAKPEPLGPPSGSRISACLASVVGSPVAVSTAPSGSAAPVARACKILPFEIVLADMSSAISPLLLGTAIAIGLVAMLATRAP